MGGVCIATVSRVINNKRGVRPETRKRIKALIAKAGYSPSVLGRSLKRRCSQNILLGVCSIIDPFFAAVSESVGDHCRALGYRLFLGDSKFDPALEAEYLSRARDGSVDGMLISPLVNPANLPLFRQLAKSGFPLVVMDNAVPTVKLNCVRYDDRLSGRIAMDYLLGKGHRRIAFIQWWKHFRTIQDRRNSYKEAHKRHRIPFSEDYILTMPNAYHDWNPSIIRALLALPQPPTAILAENEIVAVASISMLSRQGVRVPQDIAVMAFGDTLLETLAPLPLTTISMHHQEACSHAVQRVSELISHPELRDKEVQVYIQEPSLVVRESA